MRAYKNKQVHQDTIYVYKIDLTNLIVAFASSLKGHYSDKIALVYTLQVIEKYLASLSNKGGCFITKEDFSNILDYLYKKILQSKNPNKPKNNTHFWKKHLRLLIKRNILIPVKNISKKNNEVIIIYNHRGFCLI